MTCPVDALRYGTISYNRATTASHSERERLHPALRGGYTNLTFLDELAVLQTLKKFTPIVRNPEDHDRCHNSPILVHIVKQISLVDTPPPLLFLLRSILILYWT